MTETVEVDRAKLEEFFDGVDEILNHADSNGFSEQVFRLDALRDELIAKQSEEDGSISESETVNKPVFGGEIQFADDTPPSFRHLVRSTLSESNFIEINDNRVYSLMPKGELPSHTGDPDEVCEPTGGDMVNGRKYTAKLREKGFYASYTVLESGDGNGTGDTIKIFVNGMVHAVFEASGGGSTTCRVRRNTLRECVGKGCEG